MQYFILPILYCSITLQLVLSLRTLPQRKDFRRDNDRNSPSLHLLKILNNARKKNANPKPERRASAKHYNVNGALFQSLKKNLETFNDNQYVDAFLREKAAASSVAEQVLTGEQLTNAKQEEKELISITKNNQVSALLTRPFLQKKGRHDFLVMKPDEDDLFVTVVPNDIYYSIEKKCVNWLDSCSLQGIRAHLLQKVHSPYK